MSIRFKIVASILLSALIASSLGYVVVRTQLLPYLEELEQEGLLTDISRFNALIQQDITHYQSIAKDWGFWDDTYEFVQSRNQSYIDTNIQDSWLKSYQADALSIRPLHSQWSELLISDDSRLTAATANRLEINLPGDYGAGFVVLDDHVYLAGFSKIKGSDGMRPSAGKVLFYRALDQHWLNQLSERFGADISLRLDIDSFEPVKFIDKNRALVQTALPLINESTFTPVISISEPRPLRKGVMQSLVVLSVSVLFVFILFTLMLYAGLHRFLVLPLQHIRNRLLSIAGADVIKALAVRDDWTEKDELRTLQVIADTASTIIIERKQRLELERNRFEQESLLDPLTGLYNRRALERIFSQNFALGLQPLFCVIFDLDHFKRINDSYGHDAGDRVLIRFAESLRAAFDDKIVVARSGGEEFAVVGKLTDLQALFTRLCRLRHTVELELASQAAIERPITVSAGFSTCLAESGWTLGDLMLVADYALYEAKVARNTVIGYHQQKQIEALMHSSKLSAQLNQPQFKKYQPCDESNVETI